MLKPSHISSPRSMNEATFHAWADPFERPEARPSRLGFTLAGWIAAVLAAWSVLWFLITR